MIFVITEGSTIAVGTLVAGMVPCWVVVVTRGFSVAFPPEIYRQAASAEREVTRWTAALASGGDVLLIRPFAGRWSLGEIDIRLVASEFDAQASTAPWVGVHWTRHGFPDPEATILPDREAAIRWVTDRPRADMRAGEVEIGRWVATATFGQGDRSEVTEAHLAKLIDFGLSA